MEQQTFIQRLEEYKRSDSVSFREKFVTDLEKRTSDIIETICTIDALKRNIREPSFWWDWEYTEEHAGRALFNVRGNITSHNDNYYVSFFADLKDIKGVIENKEIALNNYFPLEWLDLDDDETNKAISSSIEAYIAFDLERKTKDKTKRELKIKTKEAETALRKSVIEKLKQKLTKKEQWAVGLINSYDGYQQDIAVELTKPE